MSDDLSCEVVREPFRRRLQFERHPANPVLPPVEGLENECSCCMNPYVWEEDGRYVMLYAGGDGDRRKKLCKASAPTDDVSNWTRHGVILEQGKPGGFDSEWVVLPHQIKVGERWHLYWTGRTDHGQSLASFPGLGVAVSDDGEHFRRVGDEPVLAPSGVAGDPDRYGIAGGSVVPVTGADGEVFYRYYYTGCPSVGQTHALDQQKTVCVAESRDGIVWKKRGMVMSRIPDRSYVDVASAGPVVWQDPDGLWRMVYSAIGTRWGYYSICYAESDDGLVWRRGVNDGDDLVLTPQGDGWEAQMVEYPSIVREGDGWRLFYCGNGYGTTGIGTARGWEVEG